MHSRGRAGVTISHRAVDHIEAGLPLIQSNLKVGRRAGIGEIHRAPFDVQDTIGRSTGHRRVNAAGATWISRTAALCIGAQVVPVREDGGVVIEPRQANVGEGGICGRELGVAIGR